MPHMADQIFGRSLIYICEHDEKGAMGLIINKPFPNDKAELILEKTGLNKISPNPGIYLGGPVDINNGFFLHQSTYNTKGTHQISDNLSITSNNSVIEDITNGQGPEQFRFSLGYAGWGEGQLNREVENGDWLVMPSNQEIIFNLPDEQKWRQAALQFGIDIMDVSGNTGIA